jgi:carbamate kinase
MTERKVAVVAIGGNSLIKDKQHQSVEDQYQAAKDTTEHIADMIEAGWDVAIGHGNGPQVGFILRRSEIAHKVEGMHEIPSTSVELTRREPLATPSNKLCKMSCTGGKLKNP